MCGFQLFYYIHVGQIVIGLLIRKGLEYIEDMQQY